MSCQTLLPLSRRFGVWLLLLLSAVAAQAALPPSDGPVNDAAGLLLAEDLQRMEKSTADAARAHGIEVVVVVIDRVGEYDKGRSIESFASSLFDHREIGNPGRNDGVLVLLAAGDREVRIELGKVYGNKYDSAVPPSEGGSRIRRSDSKIARTKKDGETGPAMGTVPPP